MTEHYMKSSEAIQMLRGKSSILLVPDPDTEKYGSPRRIPFSDLTAANFDAAAADKKPCEPNR